MSPELPGSVGDKTHVYTLRVYYEDTDFSGYVYHASYLRFMERGRSEFLRVLGIGHQMLLQQPEPMFWTVRSISITYTRPAGIEDALAVRTRVARIGGARVVLEQWIERDGEGLTRADVEVCVISRAGRPRRIPELIRERMERSLKVENDPVRSQGGQDA
jgi:acyl-CoA thioester hydrolase